MSRFDTLITGYSLVIMIGGLFGYLMAGSIASLVMSAIFAILLIGSLFLLRIWPIFAIRSIYTLLSILTLFFAWRAQNGKFFPSGMLSLLSVATLILALVFRKKQNQ